jgi:phosphoserine aminotransferase
MSRPIPVDHYGLIFAGAQKNLGVAGVTILIIDEALLGHTSAVCPTIFDYGKVAEANSMLNTPPTFAIYITGLVLKWLKRQAKEGLSALEVMHQRNQAKSSALYQLIDASEFYHNVIALDDRSIMNIPFKLADESLNQRFLSEAKVAGLVQLKGHVSVGGMRASLYNAMPMEGVEALIEFMRDFERRAA